MWQVGLSSEMCFSLVKVPKNYLHSVKECMKQVVLSIEGYEPY